MVRLETAPTEWDQVNWVLYKPNVVQSIKSERRGTKLTLNAVAFVGTSPYRLTCRREMHLAIYLSEHGTE